MSEWLKRAYVREDDEDACLYLWVSSYLRSEEGIARGAFVPGGNREAPAVREAARTMWAEQAPLVEVLLASTDVEVVVDPSRPRASASGPAVIWGFAATTGAPPSTCCSSPTTATPATVPPSSRDTSSRAAAA